MTTTLENSAALARSAWIKTLLYGRPGSGKTLLFATAPKPIILSVESGLLSLQKENIGRVFKPWMDRGYPVSLELAVIQIKTVDDFMRALAWLSTSEAYELHETLCLDSLSAVVEMMLVEELALTAHGQKAYHAVGMRLQEILLRLRQLPIHVVCVCEQGLVNDPITGVAQVAPTVPGTKMSQKIGYTFDEVFALEVVHAKDEPPRRCLYTESLASVVAKDRSGKLDPIEHAHFGLHFQQNFR